MIPVTSRDMLHRPKEIGLGQCPACPGAALIGLVHEHLRQLRAWRTDTGSLASREGRGGRIYRWEWLLWAGILN